MPIGDPRDGSYTLDTYNRYLSGSLSLEHYTRESEFRKFGEKKTHTHKKNNNTLLAVFLAK